MDALMEGWMNRSFGRSHKGEAIDPPEGKVLPR